MPGTRDGKEVEKTPKQKGDYAVRELFKEAFGSDRRVAVKGYELDRLRGIRRDLCDAYVHESTAKTPQQATIAREMKAKLNTPLFHDPIVKMYHKGTYAEAFINVLARADADKVLQMKVNDVPTGQDPCYMVQGHWKPKILPQSAWPGDFPYSRNALGDGR